MKRFVLCLPLLLSSAVVFAASAESFGRPQDDGEVVWAAADAGAQDAGQARSSGEKDAESDKQTEQAVLGLSKDKWQWMSERKVDALEALFHEQAVFVHMGGTMSRRPRN